MLFGLKNERLNASEVSEVGKTKKADVSKNMQRNKKPTQKSII